MHQSDPVVIFQIDHASYRLVANALHGAVVLASISGDRLFTVDRTGLGPCLPEADDLKSLLRAGRMKIVTPGSPRFAGPASPGTSGRGA